VTRVGFDTIVATATPPARSALAVIRVDGPGSGELIGTISDHPNQLAERRATRLQIRGDEAVIDEVIAIRYGAPRSFTGNDMVELMVHGNPLLVERIVDLIVRRGARIALPGEFSERAVLNGKLDLIQAESVADLINARTSLQARLSLDNLEGGLSREVAGVRESLLYVISRLEGALDFSGEGYEFITREEAVSQLGAAIIRVETLIATHARGRATVEGLTAVILGRPNSGKSSLLNFLCGSDRAIVTEIAGTTRDLLRETVEIGGLPVTFVDTAGLRDAAETVERIGIGRARDIARQADLVLYLVDSSVGLQPEDEAEITELSSPLVVFTKSDLVTEVPSTRSHAPSISLVSRSGLPEFLQILDLLVRNGFAAESVPTLVNSRQRTAADATLQSLKIAAQSVQQGLAEEIILVDLYAAARALGELTGVITPADARREIFSKFCVGK